MPALPSSLLDLIREQFLALVDLTQPAGVDTHPLGCHRPRIDDGLVFDHLIAALVFGAGYERIADATCSATTRRRWRDERAYAELMDQLRIFTLGWGYLPLAGDYDRMIGLGLGLGLGLELDDVAVGGCITKAPCGG